MFLIEISPFNFIILMGQLSVVQDKIWQNLESFSFGTPITL